MTLAGWVRDSLWHATDWTKALAQLCDDCLADDTKATPARASELAAACELVEPDRRRALAMHRLAWRLGRSKAALDRALDIARELGAHEAIGELALAADEVAPDPELLITAAFAFIDAGTPHRAEFPLARVAEARPRDEEIRSTLAMIRRGVRDPQSEIASWVARANRASRADAGRWLLLAARLARIAGLDGIYARHLEAAVHRVPDRAAASLIEEHLLAQRRADDLLAFYRQRLESATNDHEWVDLMRAAGMRLVTSKLQRGLAIRLLKSGLEHAYRGRLADIPGHLASWHVLIEHGRDMRASRELMPMVVEALGLALSDDERLFLARFGLAVTRDAKDVEAAYPYAAVVAGLVSEDTNVEELDAAELVEVAAETGRIPVIREAVRPPPVPVSAPSAPPVPAPPVAALVAAPPVAALVAAPPVAAPPAPKAVIPKSALVALRSRPPGLPALPPLPPNAVDRAERIVVPVDIELQLPDGERFAAIVRDLSTSGLFVVTTRTLGLSTTVTVALELPGPDPLSQIHHEGAARIVRRAETGYGFVWIDPSPALVDSIRRLAVRA